MGCRIYKITETMLPNFHTNLKGVMKSLVMAAVCLLFVDTLFGMDTGRKDK